ncbi:hypothetical protein DNTS_015686 [Danionella cerebrum]|uniref:Uncharacterized protein n=1 Tax=Danionella cerebrum TaxID=2873325 RepID=A0A553QCX4_9TELE|nr:hypothetical protein DNTS_015686 [Danionella translucida]
MRGRLIPPQCVGAGDDVGWLSGCRELPSMCVGAES